MKKRAAMMLLGSVLTLALGVNSVQAVTYTVNDDEEVQLIYVTEGDSEMNNRTKSISYKLVESGAENDSEMNIEVVSGDYRLVESNTEDDSYELVESYVAVSDEENVEIIITENAAESQGNYVIVKNAAEENENGAAEEEAVYMYINEGAEISDAAEKQEEYKAAGIGYDSEAGCWLWKEQPVYFLMDEDGNIYHNTFEEAEKNKIYLIVKRDEDGMIEEVKQMTIEDAMAHIIAEENEETEN